MASTITNSTATAVTAVGADSISSSHNDSSVNEPVRVVVTEASSVDVFVEGNCDPQPGTVEDG